MMTTLLFGGLLPLAAILLLGLCLLVSSIGFYRMVYFISIGYGFSIAVMSAACLIAGGAAVDWITWLQSLLLAAYGVRLGVYLVIREGNKGYRATQEADGDRSGEAGFPLKAVIWISVAALYVCMYMPALSRFVAFAHGETEPVPVLSIIGVCVMASGIAIESVADFQKSRAKRAAPKRFCDAGLYKVMRSPNYFGEMLVWTGSLLAGASLISGWLAWALSVVGYACIILIMIGSTRRLEIKQGERYGADPEYQRYIATVPVLIPLVPLYSVKNAKIYLG